MNAPTMSSYPAMATLHHQQHMNQFRQPITSNHMAGRTTTPHTTTMLGVSTPAHLNQNNLDDDGYKSFSRDSGHGGSEQEDSPRSNWYNHHQQRYANSLTADLKNSYLSRLNRLGTSDGNPNRTTDGFLKPGKKTSAYPYIGTCKKQLVTVPNNYTTALHSNVAGIRTSSGRGNTPWSHTYMEIDHDADPIYEEIERERWFRLNGGANTNDMSNTCEEDFKRLTPSDVSSRQSFRSYSDARPLLPYYSQQQEHQLRQLQQDQQYHLEQEYVTNAEAVAAANLHQQQQEYDEAVETQQHQLQQIHMSQQQQKSQQNRENLMTVAVLNGEQVVCRLSTPSNDPSGNQQLPTSSSNTPQEQPSGPTSTASPTLSNGFSAQLVLSRPQQQAHSEA